MNAVRVDVTPYSERRRSTCQSYFRSQRIDAVCHRFLIASLSLRFRCSRGLSNPDLIEERLLGGDGGVEIRRDRVSAQINYFYNRVEDVLGSAEVGFVNGKFTVQLANVAAIRSRGLESMIDLRVARDFTLSGNNTFTNAVVVEGELGRQRGRGRGPPAPCVWHRGHVMPPV